MPRRKLLFGRLRLLQRQFAREIDIRVIFWRQLLAAREILLNQIDGRNLPLTNECSQFTDGKEKNVLIAHSDLSRRASCLPSAKILSVVIRKTSAGGSPFSR